MPLPLVIANVMSCWIIRAFDALSLASVLLHTCPPQIP